MVKSLSEILKEKFFAENGLSDNEATILDLAVGRTHFRFISLGGVDLPMKLLSKRSKPRWLMQKNEDNSAYCYLSSPVSSDS
jgi:hypothetical protein